MLLGLLLFKPCFDSLLVTRRTFSLSLSPATRLIDLPPLLRGMVSAKRRLLCELLFDFEELLLALARRLPIGCLVGET